MRKLFIVSDSAVAHGPGLGGSRTRPAIFNIRVDVVVAGWWHQLADRILICPILLSQSAKSSRMRSADSS